MPRGVAQVLSTCKTIGRLEGKFPSADGDHEMTIANLNTKKRHELLFLLGLVAIVVWSAGSAAPVAAQAKTKVNPQDGLTYVWIPPGKFQMGCSPNDSECNQAEKPAHSVTITKGFWIGQMLVTQAAYKKVMGSDKTNPRDYQGDQYPINTMSWDNAQAYCEAVKMRLPTEAEWEYAARGGSAAARYAPLDKIAWYDGNSDGFAHKVGLKQANAYGLYDMLGNVWEWVGDWYRPYSAAPAVDPKGPPKGTFRMLRGGSWASVSSLVRVSLRLWSQPGDRNLNIFGVRCAGD
jgi:formylglycine-generating enzyme required for sulfatase activity